MSDTRAHLRINSITKHPAAVSYTLVLQNEPSAAESTSTAEPDCEALYSKISWRLLPIFMAMLMLNWLDRSCLAFASIQLTQQLQFSPEVYGLASGLFFLSYCLLQVPANYCCTWLGVTRWFTAIMVMFGITAASFAAVKQPWHLYVLRLLLGAAEAGSFPGVWYAISLWFPPDRIALPYSLMGASVAASQIIAAPLAAALLKLDGYLGLSGWQWVFLGEGLPSVLLGASLPWLLPTGPHALEGKTRWLSQEELQLLKDDYAVKVSDLKNPFVSVTEGEGDLSSKAAAARPAAAVASGLPLLLQVFKVWQMWYLAVCNILKDIGNVGLMMWLPVMLHAVMSDKDPLQLAATTGSTQDSEQGSTADAGTAAVLLSAIPFTCAGAAVTLSGFCAQRTGTPLWYIIIPCCVGGTALICFHWVVQWSRILGFCCLIVTLSCAFAASPHAPAVIAKLTVGPGSVIALPCYNSVAMLGVLWVHLSWGFVCSIWEGSVLRLLLWGGSMVVSGLLVLLLQCLMWRNSRTRSIICSRKYSNAAADARNSATTRVENNNLSAGVLGDGYELVYRRTSSYSSNTTAVQMHDARETELAALMGASHVLSAPVVSVPVPELDTRCPGPISSNSTVNAGRPNGKQKLHRLAVMHS